MHLIDSAPGARGDGLRPSHYRPDIQGLRAVAVVLVVAFHAGLPLNGGFIGVDVFFVISGFVITGLLTRELASTGKIALGDFYVRRFRRLLPPFALTSFITLIATAMLLSPTGAQQQAADTSMAGSLFGANVYLYRFGLNYFNPASENPFVHMWSLSVEEQIYLLLPLTLLGLWHFARKTIRPRTVMVAALALVALVSLTVSILTSFETSIFTVPLPTKFAFYLPFARVWEFLAGALLVLAMSRPPQRFLKSADFIATVGLAAVIISSIVFNESTKFPGLAALLPVAGTCVMLAFGATAPAWNRVLSSRLLTRLGNTSYEWYLWHWPAIVVSTSVWPGNQFALWSAVILSLALAGVTKRYFSSRFRYDTRLIGRRALALIAAATLIPVGSASLVKAGANQGWGVDSLSQLVSAQKRSRAEALHCDSILRSDGCLFETGQPAKVVLIGDSHAAAISDMVWDLSVDLGADFGVWTRPGCKFLLKDNTKDCADWSYLTLAWLTTTRPEIVVIHVSVGYPEQSEAETYASSLAEIARRLQSSGIQVVVLEDVPSFPHSALKSATIVNRVPTVRSMPLRAVLGEASVLRLELIRSLDGTGVVVANSVEALCEPDICTQRTHTWLYRDGNHVTHAGALRLRPILEPIVRSLLQRS